MATRPTGGSAAERNLSGSVVVILVLAAVTAVLGPLISYRADVTELRALLHDRVTREVRLHADALDHHVRLLQAELARLSERPEIDLKDDLVAPEQQLLALTHRDSALFGTGVALVDLEGRLVWSEPRDIPSLGRRVADRSWFERLLALQAPVADVLEQSQSTLVVAVPILREGRVGGALVGLVDVREGALPSPEALDTSEIAILDPDGDMAAPADGPEWARLPDLRERVESLLLKPDGARMVVGEHEHFAAATLVGKTGLRLLLVAHEDRLLVPVRGRFLLQLFLLSAVQIGAVVLLSLFVRRTYRRFVAMERRARLHEKLAALGGASSLIAHEVKNSLNGLNAAVSLLAQGGDPALPAQALKGQVDRLRHLATSLLQFGKPAEPRLVSTPLRPLVKEAVEGLKALPEAAEVALELDLGEPAPIACDPLLLATAVDNLVRNAIEAAAAAKDLGLTRTPKVKVALRREEGEVLIIVEDNAGGPPAGFERHLFEPFVTGKPKGIGLGLSMAKQAIEAQLGALDFVRLPGGSRFTIRFPIGSEPP